MPNAPRDTQKNYSNEAARNPAANEAMRTRMVPDTSAAELAAMQVPVPGLGPNNEMCQGSNPPTPGVTVSPIAMPVDNNRVPGRSGPPGP